ncbi:MAG: EpsG family protein [Ferruginibacter sp.]
MYIYCLLFILLAIIAVEYEFKTVRHSDFILVVIGIFLILFVGFRDVSVSRDYLPYLDTFSFILHQDSTGQTTLLPLFEPGFVFIVKLCYGFFHYNAAIAVMVIFAALSIVIKFFVFRKIAFNPFLVLLLYYGHYFLIEEMTQIRNGLACSLFFLALYYHLQNEKVKVFACILLAMLFHNSAVFYLLLFFIKKDNLNVWLYGTIFLAAIVLGVIQVPLLSVILPNVDLALISTKLTTYAETADSLSYDKIRFFNVLNTCNVVITAYIFLYCIKNKVEDAKLLLFLKCNIISIFVYGLLIDVPSIATRITELFGAVFPLLFAYFVKMPPFKKWNILLLIGVAFLYFYIDIFHGELLNPYKAITIK